MDDAPETKPDLARKMLDAAMGVLSEEQLHALAPLLTAGRLRPLIEALRLLEADIDAVLHPPEPKTLPDVGGVEADENLRQWLEREQEVSGVRH